MSNYAAPTSTSTSGPGHRRLSLFAVAATLVAAVIGVGLSLSASATTIPSNFFTVTDQQGANDVPGQVDLTQMGRDDTAPGLYKLVWSWDSTDSWTGTGQTGDACALFDYNNNGRIDAVVCGQVHNQNANPSIVVQNHAPYVFRCDDSKSDRCSNPSVAQTYGPSDISAGVLGSPAPSTSATTDITHNLITGTDPFGAGAANGPGSNYPNDTTLEVDISKTYLNGLAARLGAKWPLLQSPTPTLVNVCSYPSAGNGGNNNPFDCIVAPNTGFLKIVKHADTTTQTFTFDVNPVPSGTASQYTLGTTANPFVSGVASTSNIDLVAGSQVDKVDEEIPAGWILSSATCALEDTTGTGTPDTSSGTTIGVKNITIQNGKLTTCTFTDTHPAAPTVSTDTSGAGDPATGGFSQLNAITVPAGSTIRDTAQFSGPSGKPTPQGTVAFNLYFIPSTDTTTALADACGTATAAATPVFTESGQSNDTLDANGVATSGGFATSASSLGTYVWQDVYTPDTASSTNYTGATETCGVESVTVAKSRIRLTPHEASNQIGNTHTVTATVEWTNPAHAWAWEPVGNATVDFSLTDNSGNAAFVPTTPTSCTTGTGLPGTPGLGQCPITINDNTAEDVTIHATSTVSVTGVTGSFSDATGTASSCTTDTCDGVKHYFDATTTLSVTDSLTGLPTVATGTVTYTAYSSLQQCTAGVGGTDETPADSDVTHGPSAGTAPPSTAVSVPAGSKVYFVASYSGDTNNNVEKFTTGCTEEASSS